MGTGCRGWKRERLRVGDERFGWGGVLRFEDREGPENRGSTPIWWHSEKTEFLGAAVEEADDQAV